MGCKLKLSALLPLAATLACVGLLLAIAPAATAQRQNTTIVIDGSSTVGPVAKAFAQYYMDRYPNVTITVSETGSGNGAKSLINGACDIADMSRFIKPKEFKSAIDNGIYPVAHVVAMDGIAVAVHPSNPISELSLRQVKQIYTGRVTNWRELGGPNREIVVISRDTSSGTYGVFSDIVLDDEPIERAEYVQSNGAARSRVSTTPAAIAYVGLGFLEGLKAVAVNGVEPNLRTVGTGRYPIARPLFMVTDGYPDIGSHLHRFITLYLSPSGQQIVKDVGYVPVTQY